MAGSFHHLILFRLREGVTLDRVRATRERLAALVETLPGVREFVVTDNIATENDGGYKLALIASFEDRAAYEIFARHPEAREAVHALMNEIASDHLVVQGLG